MSNQKQSVVAIYVKLMSVLYGFVESYPADVDTDALTLELEQTNGSGVADGRVQSFIQLADQFINWYNDFQSSTFFQMMTSQYPNEGIAKIADLPEENPLTRMLSTVFATLDTVMKKTNPQTDIEQFICELQGPANLQKSPIWLSLIELIQGLDSLYTNYKQSPYFELVNSKDKETV